MVLYGDEGIAAVLFSSLEKYNVNVVAFCGIDNESTGGFDSLRFVPYQDCSDFFRAEANEDLLVQLAFSPRLENYEEKIWKLEIFFKN